MRKLVWDSSFRRAIKGRTRNDRGLQEIKSTEHLGATP